MCIRDRSPSVRLEVPPTTGVTAFTETHTTKDVTASPRPPHHFSTPSFQKDFPQITKRASPTWHNSASKPTSQTSAHQPAQTFLLLPQIHIKCWLAQTSTITACSPHQLKNHYVAWSQATNAPPAIPLKTTCQPTFTVINGHAFLHFLVSKDDMHKH